MIFSEDIEKLTLENEDYRRVLFTSKYSQLVLMSIPVGEDIHMEIHPDTDQFFRFEQGEGEIISGDRIYSVKDGTGVIVPYNTYHRVVNVGDVPLKLYSIYSPPHHPQGLVEKTKPKNKEKFLYLLSLF
jgi:mannose-6-phosphate isomerase-like protein (cupin superfamily)